MPKFGLGSWAASGSEHEDEGPAKITFADCSAYLVVTVESLANVSSRLPDGEAMDVTKFRPNIVLSGSRGAWEEDFWGSLEFHSANQDSREGESVKEEPARMLLTANCARCLSINVDYDTGRQGKGEAGTMLKKLMRDRRVDRGNKWSPVFGRYGFLDKVKGDNWPVVSIGDEVVIGERNKERTIWRKHTVSYHLPIHLVRLTTALLQNGQVQEATLAKQLRNDYRSITPGNLSRLFSMNIQRDIVDRRPVCGKGATKKPATQNSVVALFWKCTRQSPRLREI